MILDDFFPNLLSGFRIAEYNRYLQTFTGTRILSTSPDFEKNYAEYAEVHPQYSRSVGRFDPGKSVRGKLAYAVFINNIHAYLPTLQKEGIPFVFTLYPAGGFWLDQPESDRKLRAVMESPQFRKVIVTQKISREYLTGNGFCDESSIEFIYGGVFPSDYFREHQVEKRPFGAGKATLDICFVAHKYMEGGIDKGYDVFIAVARRLAKAAPEFRFHVVGNFDTGDADISGIEDSVVFHGTQLLPFFPGFYAGMDIILSPNTPFRLYPGNFDGFPTGCCIEAGLCGVAVFCTDELGLNIAFRDREDIVLVPRNIEDIAEAVLEYHREPEKLERLAERGRRSFNEVFSVDAQMGQRMKILGQFL